MLRRTCRYLMLPSESYKKFVDMGTLRGDARQEEALVHLDRLYRDLENYSRKPVQRDLSVPSPIRKGHQSITYVKAQAAKTFLREQGALEKVHPLSKIRGLYISGSVGTGKSALMDLFYHEAPIARKQRVHFHQFMLEVHKTQHQVRTQNAAGSLDGSAIFQQVAIKMCHNAELLCFDEMVVADVVDAMILKRLFHAMYGLGVVCVFTSNRPPHDLYLGGLNRESFLPFIRMIEEKCFVHDIQSETDYRLTGRRAETFLAPFNDDNHRKFNQLFLDITSQRIPKERVLRVFGRDVIAPKTVGAVAYFTYQELCVEDKSVADYGVLAKVFHTIFIEGLPRFGPQDSDGRRRFIALIDELYQARVKVIVLAEDELELLAASDEEVAQLRGGSGGDGDGGDPAQLTGEGLPKTDVRVDQLLKGQEETLYAGQLMDRGEGDFQMKRCISRLQEMRTHEYLEAKFEGTGDVSLLDGAPDQ